MIVGHQYFCEDCLAFNQSICERLLTLERSELENSDQVKRSHFFEGRYENLYVDKAQFEGMELILDTALHQAASLLQKNPQDLKIGFWFNLMRQGNVTIEHSHDDDDELLSGTYYISVPEHSGELVLRIGEEQKTFPAREGLFIFFDPSIPHSVTKHLGDQPRLSIGFNIGPVTGI